MSEGFTTPRDRALFGICLYGATRIREACTLRTTDVYTRKGTPRSDLIIHKENSKGKLVTFYTTQPKEPYFFILTVIVTFLIFNLIQRSRKFNSPMQSFFPQKRNNRLYPHTSNLSLRRKRGNGFSLGINFGITSSLKFEQFIKSWKKGEPISHFPQSFRPWFTLINGSESSTHYIEATFLVRLDEEGNPMPTQRVATEAAEHNDCLNVGAKTNPYLNKNPYRIFQFAQASAWVLSDITKDPRTPKGTPLKKLKNGMFPAPKASSNQESKDILTDVTWCDRAMTLIMNEDDTVEETLIESHPVSDNGWAFEEDAEDFVLIGKEDKIIFFLKEEKPISIAYKFLGKHKAKKSEGDIYLSDGRKVLFYMGPVYPKKSST
ncbi:UNVERIFIED_CONTAM: hypothetical protein BEN50_05855 [Euhalothece sp. KZN 001]